jgi:hypothetical protein
MSSPPLNCFLAAARTAFLDRFDYQIAIDALFLAKGFNVLRNTRAHLFFLIKSDLSFRVRVRDETRFPRRLPDSLWRDGLKRNFDRPLGAIIENHPYR